MTVLQSLGYVGIAARNADEWAVFATEFLGMQLGGRGDRGQLSFRMDDRCQRFFVDSEDSAPPLVVGWEVADGAALEALSNHLERAGVSTTREDASLAERRFVRDLISFCDPLSATGSRRSAAPVTRPRRSNRDARFRASAPGRRAWATSSSRPPTSSATSRSIGTCWDHLGH